MTWNELTLSDKARMIQLAVKSGITDLNTIHEVYNKFEEGGHLYSGEGSNSSMNLFTKLTLGAAMADTPAVMTASGWQAKPGLQFTQKRTEESDRLADNLEVIASLANLPDLAETVPSLVNGVTTFFKHPKQTIGHALGYVDDISKYIKEGRMFRTVDKPAIDDAISSGVIRAKTGLHHDTANHVRKHYNNYLSKIPNWDRLQADELFSKLDDLGAFSSMTEKEKRMESFAFRASSNHGGTVGYMKDTPYPNYKITKDNFVIDSPSSVEHFHAGHHGQLYPYELNDPRTGVSVLIDTSGNPKGATLTTKGSQYWKYSPYWNMWTPKKFEIGGSINTFSQNPFNYFNVSEVKYNNGSHLYSGKSKERTQKIETYKTELTPQEEIAFQTWYRPMAAFRGLDTNADDPNHYYDYRGYWKERQESGESLIFGGKDTSHFPDTYKTPGHPTFSDESKYATKENPGGHWSRVKDLKNITKYGYDYADEFYRKYNINTSNLSSEDEVLLTHDDWNDIQIANAIAYYNRHYPRHNIRLIENNTDNLEIGLNITNSNTEISKFLDLNKVSKDTIYQVNKYAKRFNLSPYELLSGLLLERSGEGILTSNTYYNTHDYYNKLLPENYKPYVSVEKTLKQLGIYGSPKSKDAEYIKNILNDRLKKAQDIIKNEAVDDNIGQYAHMVNMGGWNSMNPAQKGYRNRGTGSVVKHDYKTMIQSAAKSLQRNYPELFK